MSVLRRERNRLGLNLVEAGERCGVSIVTFSRVEREQGRFDDPSEADLLAALAGISTTASKARRLRLRAAELLAEAELLELGIGDEAEAKGGQG